MDMGGMTNGTATSSAADASPTCKISMTWNWDTIHTCYIARSWMITSEGMFAGSCIGVILIVMVLEFLRRSIKEYDGFLLNKNDNRSYRPKLFEQAVRSLLHMVHYAVAYFIMLLAMYYNGYFLICIFIGAYLGAFVFHWEGIGFGKAQTVASKQA